MSDVFKAERDAAAAKEALRAKFNELRIAYGKRGHVLLFCGRSFECSRCGCSGAVMGGPPGPALHVRGGTDAECGK